jgi:hypothetical protein
MSTRKDCENLQLFLLLATSNQLDVNWWVFYASLFFLLHKFLGYVSLLFPLFFYFINCVIYVMFCSINFHEHCLLLLVLFLVLHECYSSGVCCALWTLDHWCFVNIVQYWWSNVWWFMICVLCDHWMCWFVSIKSIKCFMNIISLQGFKVWCKWYVHCFVSTKSIRCFMSTPNSVLCLTFSLFMSISKFASRVESLVLVICVPFHGH